MSYSRSSCFKELCGDPTPESRTRLSVFSLHIPNDASSCLIILRQGSVSPPHILFYLLFSLPLRLQPDLFCLWLLIVLLNSITIKKKHANCRQIRIRRSKERHFALVCIYAAMRLTSCLQSPSKPLSKFRPHSNMKKLL